MKQRGEALTIVLLAIVLIGGGCAAQGPQRGGVATIGKALFNGAKWSGEKVVDTIAPKTNTANPKPVAGPINGELATITQPDNPASQSTQNYGFERSTETTYSAPTTIVTETQTPTGSIIITENIPAGSKRNDSVKQTVGQSLGAAQKDTARADAAKLASFKGVQWLGAICLVAGALCFFHPALRAIVGGKDTAMALGGAGLVMVFGPTLFVTYEKYFFLAIIGVAIYWALARFKYQHGRLDALEKPPQ